MSEFAYAQLYWKVTLTCIILAAYCPRTCGKYTDNFKYFINFIQYKPFFVLW